MVYFTNLRIFVLPKAELKEALTGEAVEQRFVFFLAGREQYSRLVTSFLLFSS